MSLICSGSLYVFIMEYQISRLNLSFVEIMGFLCIDTFSGKYLKGLGYLS